MLALFIISIHLCQNFTQQVAIHWFFGRFLYSYHPSGSIQYDDNIPLCFSLKFERIKPGEFDKRAEITAGIASALRQAGSGLFL